MEYMITSRLKKKRKYIYLLYSLQHYTLIKIGSKKSSHFVSNLSTFVGMTLLKFCIKCIYMKQIEALIWYNKQNTNIKCQ